MRSAAGARDPASFDPQPLAERWRERAEGPNLLQIDLVDSTQHLARRILERHRQEDEVPMPYVVLAGAQSAGRGREGRRWSSGAQAGTWSSLVRRVPRGELPVVPMRVAVALSEVCRRWRPDVRIKWPNDLVVAEGKLAGLLVDAVSEGDEDPWVIVGFGVNYLPPDLEDLSATGAALAGTEEHGIALPTLATVSAALVESVAHALQREDPSWRAKYGEASAHRAGDEIACRVGGRELSGRFVGFDGDGFLVLESEGGRETIRSGEVFAW